MTGSPSRARHISVTTRRADIELSRIHTILPGALLVDSRGDLEALLGRLLASDEPSELPMTLDLIGHSTPDTSLLQLGDWVIDAASPTVTAFFRELADQDVLPRLGVHSLRLLGSKTAETEQGRHTICALAKILEVEVYGVLGPLCAANFDAHGFRDDRRLVVRSSADLRGDPSTAPLPQSPRSPRALDIDSLPREKLGPATWPRYLVGGAARDLLGLIRRDEGALMPGLLATPTCELALPSSDPDAYHVAQILLDYEAVRVYPDGPDEPAIVYPVRDRFALHELVATLTLAPNMGRTQTMRVTDTVIGDAMAGDR